MVITSFLYTCYLVALLHMCVTLLDNIFDIEH